MTRPCAVVGCERDVDVRVVCDQCQREWWINDGRLPSPARMLDFIRACCIIVGECWIPQFPVDAKGYTQVNYGYRRIKTHRLVPILQHEIECGQEQDWKRPILHDVQCEYLFRTGAVKSRCVNPDHLRLGSISENEDDKLIVQSMIERVCQGDSGGPS